MSTITLHPVTLANSSITVPAVLHLVQALALFEKSPESVEATVPLLRRNLGFEDPVNGHKYAEVVLAYADGGPGEGKAVGMALYLCVFLERKGPGERGGEGELTSSGMIALRSRRGRAREGCSASSFSGTSGTSQADGD